MTHNSNLLRQLRRYLKGDFVIVGVGNEFNELDKVGVEIARKGKEVYPEKFIDCGLAPENYIGKIVGSKAKTLIILDAVRFDGNDRVRVLLPEELSNQGISTHSLSLEFLARYLRNHGIDTLIVGIKPDRDIEKTGDEVLSQILDLIEDTQTHGEAEAPAE